jgi:hypothetical protein
METKLALGDKICYICKRPIRNGEAWTIDKKGRYVHWVCLALAERENLISQIADRYRDKMATAQKLMLHEEVEIKRVEEAKMEEEAIAKEEKKPIPAVVIEPELQEKEENGKKLLIIPLPEITNLEQINIKELNESIEIRANNGNKAYFKIIPKKKITSKRFENSTLIFEVE